MCGEMAADPLMVPILVGLGLRQVQHEPAGGPGRSGADPSAVLPRVGPHGAAGAPMVTAREVEEYLLERLAIVLAKTKIRV